MTLVSDDSRILSPTFISPIWPMVNIGENILDLSVTNFMNLPPNAFDVDHITEIRSELFITVLGNEQNYRLKKWPQKWRKIQTHLCGPFLSKLFLSWQKWDHFSGAPFAYDRALAVGPKFSDQFLVLSISSVFWAGVSIRPENDVINGERGNMAQIWRHKVEMTL